MKVAVYARVSTKGDEQNPNTQLVKLREFCRNRKYEIFDEYVDKASGTSWDRPDFTRLMDDAYHKRIEGVIVTKLDRFGRSLIDLESALQSFQKWGIDFICVDQPIDTTTPSGKLVYHILSAVAEFERELIRERVKDGLKRAKAEGRKLGRPKKELDEKLVCNMYKELQSLRKVAKKLNVSHVFIHNLLKKHPENFQSTNSGKNVVNQKDDKLTGRRDKDERRRSKESRR